MKVQTTVTIEISAEDFEMMSNCRMAWGKTWKDQINAGRFGQGNVTYDFSTIYWFENRLSLIMAEAFLRSIGSEFLRAYDTYTEQEILLTDYVGA